MQILRGKPNYPVPADLGRVVHLMIDERERMGISQAIYLMRMDELEGLRRGHGPDTLGVPQYAAVDGKDQIWFWPAPDADYPVTATYEPKPKQF